MTGDTRAPERLGPYRLLRKIGEGGMGVVHLGLDEDGREVAVKVLHPHVAADLKARDRLTREVETMRRVRSPHVAEVLDAELTARQPYIVTRFAPGRTLEETVLQDGPLPDDQVIRLARGMCAALVAIHAADVIHRDFKPSNVMIVNGDPLVIDFGIAHLVNATRLTQTGMFVGTPGYLAPEIIRDSEITQAADVHALASTVFFGATGKPPFGTGSFEVVCFNIMEGRANIDLAPAWLRGWLRRALAVDPVARPVASELLRLARDLDPSVTVFQETPPTSVLEGGTRVLGGDGTKILDGDGAKVPPLPPPVGGTRSMPQDTSGYSDLLPPVNYAEPERRERRPRQERGQASGSVAPPPYIPAPPSAQARAAAPPPYPDQRVAGYPAPPPTGQARPYPPPVRSSQHVPTQERGGARTSPPVRPAPRTPPQERYRAAHPLAGMLLLTILVALACVLPVVVSVFAVAAALCLRVGEYLFADLAQRRSVRGNSAGDPLLALVGTPWALIRSGMATTVTAGLSMMFGMCVWGFLVYAGDMDRNFAAAYAAGAFVAGLFVLPGGGKPRKAVARSLSAVIRSPGAGMVTTIVLGTLAFFAVMAALSVVPSFEPWQNPTDAVNELTREWRRSANEGAMGAFDLVTGLVDDLMKSLGLGFLTFWK
ncbi:serine/threonine-protein kinase [Streptosporangium sp. NPDC023615]|uniref:serine/threonine-protein kinase n=1 Tax=Streptosporangium sp. NPDC023615 TaxID=3154794 RepID=UPI003430C401